MKNLELLHPVTIKGTNVFGLPSKITFRPGPADQPRGWYWQYRDSVIPIQPVLAQTKSRRIVLQHGALQQLNIFEHIGFLRWMGYNHLTIEASGWPPFCGGARFYYERLRGQSDYAHDQSVQYQTVTGSCDYVYPKRRKEGWGVDISPGISGSLSLLIRCEYKSLGAFERKFVLPDDCLLHEICQENTVGIPHELYYLSLLIAPKKRHKINWLVELGAEEFKRRLLLHRAQDLLGALSFLCSGERLFAGNVLSQCAGHMADIMAVRDASTKLRSLVEQPR